MIITDRLTDREITKQGGGYLSGAGSIDTRTINITDGVLVNEPVMILMKHSCRPRTAGINMRFTGTLNAEPKLLGWNGQEVINTRGFSPGSTAVSIAPADNATHAIQIGSDWYYFLILQPIGTSIRLNRIALCQELLIPTANDWAIVRPIRHRFPPLAFSSVRYARQKRATRSITGKEFVTNLSPDQILSFNVKLKAEPDDNIAQGIGALDADTDGFGVFPMGDSLALAEQGGVEYRRFGVCRNMILSKFTGWTGNAGVDTLGATGTATFKETV